MSNGFQHSAGRRVGVVGGGQLARMMGEAAHHEGVALTVLTTSPDDPAVATCDDVVVGGARDFVALERLARVVDVVTFDHELVDLEQIGRLEAQGVVVRPSATALRFAADKAHQRRAFRAAGLPVPRFLCVRDSTDPQLAAFLEALDGPPVVKAARGGYDGRGVGFPVSREQALVMIDEIDDEVVVEERLDLLREVAQLVVRGVDGSLALYPLVTTVQSQGMCVEVRYPSAEPSAHLSQARELAGRIAELVNAVGVLAIEFFVTRDGLVINEIALRPHNSGHWTIEGAATSQFANHLRAVSGQSLGDASATGQHVVMVNVIGDQQRGSLSEAGAVSGASVHDYGKSWRPGRKLGHVTVVGDDPHWAHVTAWRSARAYGTGSRET